MAEKQLTEAQINLGKFVSSFKKHFVFTSSVDNALQRSGIKEENVLHTAGRLDLEEIDGKVRKIEGEVKGYCLKRDSLLAIWFRNEDLWG